MQRLPKYECIYADKGVSMKTKLLTVTNLRTADALAVKNGISEDTLMQHAGDAVVDVITSRFTPVETAIFAGPGNNGGDALVVKKGLEERGWSVHLVSTDNNFSSQSVKDILINSDLIVDGLLGSGLTRPLEGSILKCVELINESKKTVVSIDVPTGIEGTSGSCFGSAVKATLTVTFTASRLGHYLLPGRSLSGEVIVKDIGIPPKLIPDSTNFLNSPALWVNELKTPSPYDHKYSRGACLIFGNGSMPGALRLSSMSARRVGAGLVRITCNDKDYSLLELNMYDYKL